MDYRMNIIDWFVTFIAAVLISPVLFEDYIGIQIGPPCNHFMVAFGIGLPFYWIWRRARNLKTKNTSDKNQA